tara:strand:- start:161 stop:385 length:225 start_codon:yes stop_codon:yes gene_type:complete
MTIKLHKICLGCIVGCNHSIKEFQRGLRYSIVGFGFGNGDYYWVFRELSSEQKEFSVNKDYADLLIYDGNIKNL